MPERQQTLILDGSGDVTLLVGKHNGIQQLIRVLTSATSQASSVWKAMFSRVWAEYDASEISLPDYDLETTILVLRIAHLRSHGLPVTCALQLEVLLNLADICDKYDLCHIVWPFLDHNN
jgi:hypothetical protein